MNGFHDFLIDSDIEDLAGWSREAAELDTVILEASDWGELKRKIGEKREDADILVFKGGGDFNAKACKDSRLDIVLVRGSSRISQSTAEAASNSGVRMAFDFSDLRSDRVEKMKAWKTGFKILESHEADYMVTTNAGREKDVRAPRDLAALIDELGGNGRRAVKKVPSRLMQEVEERKAEGVINRGVEEL